MQSRKIASASINLLTRIGEPVIATRPDGLGKKSLALIGGIAGLLIGLGLVMIVAPPFYDDPFAGRTSPTDEASPRLQDHLPDHVRETPPAPTQPPPPQRQPVPPPTPETAQPSYVSSPPATTQTAPAPASVPAPAPIRDAVQSSFNVGGAAIAAAAGGTVAAAAATVTKTQSTYAQTSQVAVPSVAPEATPEASTPPAPVTAPSAPQQTEPVVSSNPNPAESVPSANASAESVQETEPTRPASKTLAAIFANMPQPRTDIAVDASSATAPEETVSPEVSTPARQSEATIQLPADAIPDNPAAIPLQRRTTYRPVDLAKQEDATKQPSDATQESIDEVFSELKPKPGQTSKRTAPQTEVYDDDSN